MDTPIGCNGTGIVRLVVTIFLTWCVAGHERNSQLHAECVAKGYALFQNFVTTAGLSHFFSVEFASFTYEQDGGKVFSTKKLDS